VGLVGQIFGSELADQVVVLEPQELPGLPYTVRGILSRPQFALPSRRGIRLFVNGRPIRSTALSRSILVAYKNFLPVGRGPLALVFIETPPGAVDVNVHPAKLEVRLEDGYRLEDSLAVILRAALGGRTGTGIGDRSRTESGPPSGRSGHVEVGGPPLRSSAPEPRGEPAAGSPGPASPMRRDREAPAAAMVAIAASPMNQGPNRGPDAKVSTAPIASTAAMANVAVTKGATPL
jgi:hypothetical protein